MLSSAHTIVSASPLTQRQDYTLPKYFCFDCSCCIAKPQHTTIWLNSLCFVALFVSGYDRMLKQTQYLIPSVELLRWMHTLDCVSIKYISMLSSQERNRRAMGNYNYQSLMVTLPRRIHFPRLWTSITRNKQREHAYTCAVNNSFFCICYGFNKGFQKMMSLQSY